MRKFILFLNMLCISVSVSAQQWMYLENAPVMSSRFDDIYFINDSTGWAVNGNGEIWKTSDYGNAWSKQLQEPTYFRSVEFINDTVGIAGTLNGRAYKTTNAGETWARIDGSFPQPVSGICGISHFGTNIMMVGIWNSPARMLTSNDSGESWTYKDMSAYAHALVDCWYKTADTVFVAGSKIGTRSGIILRSVNGGADWAEVTPAGVPDAIVWKLQFVTDKIGYASVYEGSGSKTHVLKTIDGGKSYSLIKALDINIDAEGIGFINESEGWIGGWSDGMHYTNDGGVTWTFSDFGANLNRYFIIRENYAYAAGKSIYSFNRMVTGVDNQNGKAEAFHSVSVFPNPVKGSYVTVELDLKKSTMAVLELYDMQGQFKEEIISDFLKAGKSKHKFGTNHLPEGSYVVLLRTNEHAVRTKVAITK